MVLTRRAANINREYPGAIDIRDGGNLKELIGESHKDVKEGLLWIGFTVETVVRIVILTNFRNSQNSRIRTSSCQ